MMMVTFRSLKGHIVALGARRLEITQHGAIVLDEDPDKWVFVQGAADPILTSEKLSRQLGNPGPWESVAVQ